MMAYTLPRLMPLMRLLRILKDGHLFLVSLVSWCEPRKRGCMAKTSAANNSRGRFRHTGKGRKERAADGPATLSFGFPQLMDGGACDYWVTYTPPSTLTTTGALETSPLVPQVMPVPVRPSTLKLLSVKVAMSFSQMS